MSRKDQLKKWREEKELKRKLESRNKHQTFKVAHVVPEVVAFSKQVSNLPKVCFTTLFYIYCTNAKLVI